ncbi:MAG TPA: hypothetical protein VN915_07095 [Elusimicrobiota bacterium]|nr:hypothetical protein [Elusimicrobiota bacterium]
MMKNNTPRYTPLFVALSVVLTCVPQAAFAQVLARPVAAPVVVAGAAAAPAALAPATTLAPSLSLTGATSLGAAPTVLAAPSISAAPAPLPASALAAPPLAAVAAPAAASLPANAAPESVSIPTPGAAATGVAAEAAAYVGDEKAAVPASAAAPAPAVRKGLAGRLADVVMGRSSFSALFDSSRSRGEVSAPVFGRMGLQPQKPVLLPNGTRTDEHPTIPSPDRETTVTLQTYDLPGARDIGGVLETNRKVLNADPNDVAAVVAALKGMVDADRARYGVTSAELRLIGARKFTGRGEQADSIFVHFRQVKDNMIVNGANLSFTLKVIDGKPMVVAQTGSVFPQLDVNLESTLTDDQIMGKIAERVGMPVSDVSAAFQFSEEKIIYSRGSWHHVKLYVAEGLPFMIAVDLATGLVFAWDNRTGVQAPASDSAAGSTRLLVDLKQKGLSIEEAHALLSRHGVELAGYRAEDGAAVVVPGKGADMIAVLKALKADPRVAAVRNASRKGAPGVGGTIAGNAVDHGPILPAAQLKKIPLAFLNLTIGGKTYTTDKDGRFTADGLQIAPEGLTLTATLSGPFVNVQDSTGQTLTINVTLKPGDGEIQAIFAPDATINDENAIAQVSAFQKVNLAYSFLKARNLTTERMDKEPITVRTNVDDECNAYYTPGSPSLNFFKSSANCVNSAYDTVADHEYGHYWDDMTGGIMNGGLSEGWGDILSMYLLNNPVIGEHFLKVARDGKDYIRHGENTYQYNEYDEVHDQGQAWQGFGWKLRKALMKELGDAEGAALAEAMVLPTMFAKAATIPAAMAQVLVNAMKKDGTIQYESLIRATAKIHGIDLPQNPGKGFIASMVERFTAPLRKLRGLSASFDGGRSTASGTALGLEPLAADAPTPNVRAALKFTAGALLRRRVANEIRRYMDETGLKYTLNEYKSWTSSDFLLVIEGPQDKVQEHSDNISRWLSSLERSN